MPTTVPRTAAAHAPRPAHAADVAELAGHPRSAEAEQTTRERILRLVVEAGPVSVHDLARDLELTPAGVRRHVVALEECGQIAEHRVGAAGPTRRGRPARRFVATERGQAGLTSAYPDLAAQALHYLSEVVGSRAVEAFAGRRAAELRERHASSVSGSTPAERAESLASALSADGFAASVRPVPGGRALQLCQGHCPVQDVAAQFPQLCEAETRVFSELLGVHVQRLSTLATGGHVCTTHVPLAAGSDPPGRSPSSPDPDQAASEGPARGAVEGTR